ncbi:MAG TPA: flagellar biosynthetic protein FliO [Ramlibacter sp.]|nr:flagellar biosynthetic protein FliO [Ramlibacter sp.]
MGAGGYALWLLVVLAGVAVLWALRSRGGAMPGWLRGRMGAQACDLAVVSSRVLGPNASVQVIRWNGKELLLGCTSQSISVLDSKPAAGVAGPVVASGTAIETPDAGGPR